MPPSFRERIGTASPKPMQIGSMDAELQNCLWNIFHEYILKSIENYDDPRSLAPYIHIEIIWKDFFKGPIDEIPYGGWNIREKFKEFFFGYSWDSIYELLEFTGNSLLSDREQFRNSCNRILEREKAGYKFIEEIIVPISNNTEIKEIENALNQTDHFGLTGANHHIKSAIKLYSDKKNPDYTNSIKESISAVESICKSITNNKKATLGDALKTLGDKIKIHPALHEAFNKIYGYTSDGDGIRHGSIDISNSNMEDANYFLVSCSAFVHYLITKSNKAGINLANPENR